MSVTPYLCVTNAKAAIEAAPEDRATELRRAVLFDPFGHRWLITAPLY